MTTNTELECKKFYVMRCLYAISYSVVMQYLLLFIFLLLANFEILHPITWITGTFSLILSFYTWICIMPLIIAVIMHGLFLGKLYFDAPIYYPTRIMLLYKTSLRKGVFLSIHIFVGFLTAWLNSKFLSNDYKHFYYECFDDYCINEKYLFLILNGIYASLFYFITERVKKQKALNFSIIQQSIYLEIRSHLCTIVYKSFGNSCLPTVAYVIGYYLLGSLFRSNVAIIFGTQIKDNFHIFDLRLIFYIWILSSQIFSNMRLMDFLFSKFLTEYKEFPIEHIVNAEHQHELTLVEGLAAMNAPIVQQLATLDLYTLANKKDSERRTQIYTLSIPGGHPYNWNALCGQCLSLINLYREELSKSIENITIIQNNNQTFVTHIANPLATATEMADKIRYRQYNENFGIRNMSMQNTTQMNTTESDPYQRFNDIAKLINDKYNSFKVALLRMPGINFFFAEYRGAKACFLLNKSQHISLVVQGIAAMASHSVKEDKYGVVQNDLANIIKSLLQLKQVLDRVNNICFEEAIYQQKCFALRNSVRRSIYSISTIFADYIKDLITDPNDFNTIQSYVHYKEA